MDGTSDANALGPAGYVIAGSGGGGAGGQYVFASLEHLDRVIAKWQAFRDGIQGDGDKLIQASQLIIPPAEDLMSRMEAKMTVHSLDKAQEHNRALYAYADGYITKLQGARAEYAVVDEDSANNLRNADGR